MGKSLLYIFIRVKQMNFLTLINMYNRGYGQISRLKQISTVPASQYREFVKLNDKSFLKKTYVRISTVRTIIIL